MNINNPRISVVIPSFNSGPYLKDCLTSVINQTLPPFEIFVINDGSTDDSLDVLNQFREKICVINQNNKGVSAARNAGIIASTGSWIAIQDSDDIWELTKLEKQWKALASCTDNTIMQTFLHSEKIYLGSQETGRNFTVLTFQLQECWLIGRLHLMLLFSVALLGEKSTFPSVSVTEKMRFFLPFLEEKGHSYTDHPRLLLLV